MQQTAIWLNSIGLGAYAQRFAENGIDFSVLRYLTDQDLEKIGVLLGHRRKMLASIGELGNALTNMAPARASRLLQVVDVPATSATAAAAGERRHVTVL